eukprot:gnl/TRDRNA2_/TRDRNA2_129231_c0_seq2.p1 gnl/TRDRNA2_/TRDRNA2_129231_c0~~gnl/TRDRNA2_/TRDRNA2_129231_c0_seq2.p1  ORF type:complete len:525 (-),score=138.61 gnl/TRDRNA2_/TRDRNA2_129231_c0_seq2:119-1693(-)
MKKAKASKDFGEKSHSLHRQKSSKRQSSPQKASHQPAAEGSEFASDVQEEAGDYRTSSGGDVPDDSIASRRPDSRASSAVGDECCTANGGQDEEDEAADCEELLDLLNGDDGLDREVDAREGKLYRELCDLETKYIHENEVLTLTLDHRRKENSILKKQVEQSDEEIKKKIRETEDMLGLQQESAQILNHYSKGLAEKAQRRLEQAMDAVNNLQVELLLAEERAKMAEGVLADLQVAEDSSSASETETDDSEDPGDTEQAPAKIKKHTEIPASSEAAMCACEGDLLEMQEKLEERQSMAKTRESALKDQLKDLREKVQAAELRRDEGEQKLKDFRAARMQREKEATEKVQNADVSVYQPSMPGVSHRGSLRSESSQAKISSKLNTIGQMLGTVTRRLSMESNFVGDRITKPKGRGSVSVHPECKTPPSEATKVGSSSLTDSVCDEAEGVFPKRLTSAVRETLKAGINLPAKLLKKDESSSRESVANQNSKSRDSEAAPSLNRQDSSLGQRASSWGQKLSSLMPS